MKYGSHQNFLAIIFIALCQSLVLASSAYAEDIDIYSGTAANSDLPNVLLVLDNSANWSAKISVGNCYYKDNGVLTTVGTASQSKKMGIEQCALYNTIDALPTGVNGEALFNVGLMLLNEPRNNGAYPRIAFTSLSSANKADLKATIKGLDVISDKGSNADFAKAMYEAYLYYKGETPYQGTAGSKWAAAAVSGGKYVSPSASSCGRNYIIFIANGSPEASENNSAKDLLTAVGGSTAQITYPTTYVSKPDQANWADEFARFMSNQDVSSKDGMQSIVTYTIAVTGASSDGNYPNFMKSMSKYGGGDAFTASNVDDLTKYLLNIFNQIQSVNSVFASASLPVSVNAQGTYLNQVFMGMFRPDGNAHPRWRGNLKQYKFGYDVATDTLQLVDSLGVSAISATTGFIAPGAVSYWSSDSTFWRNEPQGSPSTGSDAPDGEVVEKGGAAQRTRSLYANSQDARKIYTCIDCAVNTVLSAGSANKFESTNSSITQSLLGVGSATDRTNLIEWARGLDNAGDELGPGSPVTIRPSVHGDVLHSRPLVVNFGTSTVADVVVFYGANDGTLRAVNGNQTGATAGQELWSFVPQELFGKLKRLRDNSPNVRLSTTSSSLLGPIPRDYLVDGPIGIYQRAANASASAKVIVYVSMRRGGRVIYAMDVTTPSAPVFLWKKSNADIPILGQTWSEAKVAKIKGYANPVLVMGAGYDAVAEDAAIPGTTTMGNAVLVLDAYTGTLLKTLNTDRSVPADVRLVDTDSDGFIDRIYAVDVGGNIYRVDFETIVAGLPANGSAHWGIYKLASLSGSGTRKFFYPPDVVVTKAFTAVMAGSGDREKPLNATSTDAFFTVFDARASKGTPAVGFAAITPATLFPVRGVPSITQTDGCYIAMNTAGEKIVNAPTTAFGVTYFSSNMPSPPTGNSCNANLGIAKVYTAPLFCRAPGSQIFTGGGLPPSPVVGLVSVDYPNPTGVGTSKKIIPFVIGAPNDKKSGAEASKPQSPTNSPRKRRYWYQENAK